jgi:hypothetical protein
LPSSPSGASNAASSTGWSPADRHQRLRRDPQPRPQAVRLEGRSQRHHRRRQMRVPSVRFDPLEVQRGACQDDTIRRESWV